MKRLVIAGLIAGVVAGISRAYMLYLKVPAVVEVRPELMEVGLLTGLFSGRGYVYLFLHYPDVVTLVEFVLFFVGIWFIFEGVIEG